MRTYTVSSQQNIPHPLPLPIKKPQMLKDIEIELNCPKCGKHHKIKAYPEKIKIKQKNQLITPDEKLICDNCGFEIDLEPIKNDLELKLKTKIKFN